MSGWVALASPRKDTRDYTGRCLPFAQSFFGAPIMYDSAWDAWNATKFKHGPEIPLPDVPVLLWYSHYGTYYSYSKGYSFYGNWGHVTPYVPGDAIYSSPARGYGQDRYETIAEVERVFGAKYVGWSEDINGLRVAENTEGDNDMTPQESQMLSAIWQGMFGPANAGGKMMNWQSVDGPRNGMYGVIDIDTHTQGLVAQLIGQVAALTELVSQSPDGGSVDMSRIEAAAEKGAREALSDLTLKSDTGA